MISNDQPPKKIGLKILLLGYNGDSAVINKSTCKFTVNKSLNQILSVTGNFTGGYPLVK